MDQREAGIHRPVVSVIVPCYNYSGFLPALFDSLRQQTLHNWECIVVDDGSTDDTKTVTALFAGNDPRIRYQYQANAGQASARNRGLSLARGNFIQFLDADDLLEPGKLEKQSDFLLQHPAVDIVYGGVRYFLNDDPSVRFMNRWGNQEAPWMPAISGQGKVLVKAFVERNIFELGCALFRTAAVRLTGPFNPSLTGVEDYDFCFRAAIHGLKFQYLSEPDTAVLMRHHTVSYSKNLLKMYKQELRFRRLTKKLLVTHDHKDLVLLNQARFESRLRRLQEETIDQVRKGKYFLVNSSEMWFHFTHADPGSQLYFFPRILKAWFTGARWSQRTPLV